MRVADNFSTDQPAGFEWNLKPRRSRPTQREPVRQAAETDRVASSSNAVEMSRMLMTPIRPIVLEHRQMADVFFVHEMANMFERIVERRKPVAALKSIGQSSGDAGAPVFGAMERRTNVAFVTCRPRCCPRSAPHP